MKVKGKLTFSVGATFLWGLISPFALSNTVNFLEVENDTAIFSTSEAKANGPACVLSEFKDKWAVSLSSDSGRAMYSLIMTALAKSESLQLSVTSANDCGVLDGVERALDVSVQAIGTNISEPPHPTQTTILNWFVPMQYVCDSEEGSNSGHPNSQFWRSEPDFRQTGSVTGTRRYKMLSVNGPGYLTSIVLPQMQNDGNTVITLEVVIDGRSQVLVFEDFDEPGYRGYRRFVAANFAQSDAGCPTILESYKTVTEGKAVPFKSSLEMYITMSQLIPDGHKGWRVEYLLGGYN